MASFSRGIRHSVLLLAVLSLAAAPQDDKKEREDAAKKKVEEFKTAIKEAKGVLEKAQAILVLGEAEPKDAVMVGPIAAYLAPTSADINYVLPCTACEALSKFRGSQQASARLIASLPAFKAIPYVQKKIVMAIGRVGHESALTVFEPPLRGRDAKAAVDSVEAIAVMPPAAALESLFREYDRAEKRKSNATDDEKKVIDAVQAAIVKEVKTVSGEKYPTFAELQIWWQKRGAAWREQSAAKEKEAAAKKELSAAKPLLPPVMIVEFTFRENGGTTTANSGSSSGHFPMANITGGKPNWTGSAPPNGGPSALDWGATAGPNAVDLRGMIEHLRNLKSFTLSGWLNCKSEKEAPTDKAAPAGNRILTWLMPGKEGVELVHRSDGSLQLGVNQWADASSARSQAAQIPVLEEKANAAAIDKNWRFFAVTYDSGLAAGHVKFYVGTKDADAKAAGVADCNRGPVGGKIAPELSVGNLTSLTRPIAQDRTFKGLIDEIRIFGSTLDGSGALGEAAVIKVQNRTVATP